MPLVAYADELPLIRRYYRAVFGVRPAVRAQVIAPDLRAVMNAVLAGAGVSVLPRYLASSRRHDQQLALVGVSCLPRRGAACARR